MLSDRPTLSLVRRVWCSRLFLLATCAALLALSAPAVSQTAPEQPATQPAAAPRPVSMARIATGAHVDDSACKLTLYVDPTGDDARDGLTAGTALKSLGAAIERAKDPLNRGDGVRVILAPGTYREGYVVLDGNALTAAGRDALLVIQGVAAGQVTISGAVADGWQPSTWQDQPRTETGVYTYRHAWPYEFKIEPEEKPADALIQFREMLVLNGHMLRQEASPDKLAPDSFYVDRDSKGVYITLGRELMPSDAIEIPEKEALLTIRSKNNLVLRNLDFAFCNPHIMGGKGRCVDGDWSRAVEICTHGAARDAMNRNVLIEDCSFNQNNSTGLGLLNVQDITLRRCVANTNGWKGIGLTRARNALLVDCQTSHNAWRQLWSTSRFHDSGGIKIIPNCDTVTLRRFTALDNTVTHGIWTDSGITNFVLDECRVEDHSSPPPVYFEMGRGPHLVRNCFIKNQNGIVLRGSSDFIFEGNYVQVSRGPAITLMEDPRNQRRGRTDVEGVVLRNNRFVVGRGGLFNSIQSWPKFYSRLWAQDNIYRFAAPGERDLGLYDADGQPVSFQQWQRLGFDTQSQCTVGAAASDPAD